MSGEVDFTMIAQMIDDLRETCRAAVAGLREDGFTDREAHAIVAGVFSSTMDGGTEEEES